MNDEEYQNVVEQTAMNKYNQDAAASNQMEYLLEEKEKGIVELQLEVDSIKEDIYHLIRQDTLKFYNDGRTEWVPLKNEKERTLTEWGVERIMQVIHFYINKNTLLSNFNEEQINRLMLKFMCELNDLVLLKYQVLFRQPTFEECKEIILEKIESKRKMRIFASEIFGREFNEEEIKVEVMSEMEKILDREMEKVREDQRKEKIRDYGLMLAQLEIVVFSCLNRAFRGEERGSFRRHTNISELIGAKTPQMPSQKSGGIFSWGRR